MPCVSHGQCRAIGVLGGGAGEGIAIGAFAGVAPRGSSVAAADGTIFGAAAAAKSKRFNA